MISRHGDDDFEFFAGTWHAPAKCLAVEPGPVDFPGRCVEKPGHHPSKHRAAVAYVGRHAQPFPPASWDNDDD